MGKDYIVTGLDIGSSKTTALTARLVGGLFEILGQISLPSKGVSRGMFTDLSEATDTVSKVLAKLREKTGKSPGEIYVNISGQTVKGAKSIGMIPLSLRGREIAAADMDRAVGVASTIHLPFDREIIHRIVHNFSIDDQSWISNPLGLYASRLSCDVYIITGDVNHIQSIYKCVNSAGYDLKELVYTGIADGASLLDKAEKEEGAVLVDFGDTLTEASFFFGGSLAELDISPVGSKDFGPGFKESADFNNVILRIAARAQDFIRGGGRVSSVVLTGGMVFADGIIEFLEGKLPYPIKMGVVKDVRGDISSIESIRFSTAIGLAKYGYGKYLQKLAERKNPARRLSDKIVAIFNNYF
jgi:Actin-like ATPase involved in cell division